MPVIEFTNVSKSFSRTSRQMLLRSHLRRWFTGGRHERFYALKDVSFRLNKGEGLAVIGHNGAGKSTLLGLIAGLCEPDRGAVKVNGNVAALLELGSGFHPDLTGIENVRLNAALLGLGAKQVAQTFDRIVEFSGIGDFIHEPLRTYSSGMVMRLAFSVAVHTDPDILLIDEVLAVGDQAFQAKCFDKIYEFRRLGKSMVCVSHASAVLRELCDRAIWLDHGELVMTGTVAEVSEAYAGRQAAAR